MNRQRVETVESDHVMWVMCVKNLEKQWKKKLLFFLEIMATAYILYIWRTS